MKNAMQRREPKQSFLERLTGVTRSNEEEIYHELPTRPPAHIEPENFEEEIADEDSGDENVGQLAVDVYITDTEIVIQSMVAGVMPEHLNINITRTMVSIRGRRVGPEGIADEQYLARELYWGEFERLIELPYEIDTEGAEAVEKYGLLIIRLPRIHTDRSQRLEVKSI